MFCPNCGKEVTDGAKFCIYCGKPVSTDTSQESTFEDSPANTVIQNTQDQDVGLEVENQNTHASIPTKKKSTRSKIVIGLAVVAVCIALGVGLRFYHDYQLKVKMAEIYKERFGIEIDPNDLTLYDNLQDAMADDSWQGGSNPTLTQSPFPEEGMMTTTEYDRDGNIISVTTEPIQSVSNTQSGPASSDGSYDDIAGTYIDENGYGFYMFIGYDDSSKQAAYANIVLVMEDILVKLERDGNFISGSDYYRSLGSTPSQIVEMIYSPGDGSITATIYSDTMPNGDTMRFVPYPDAPYSNPFYVG